MANRNILSINDLQYHISGSNPVTPITALETTNVVRLYPPGALTILAVRHLAWFFLAILDCSAFSKARTIFFMVDASGFTRPRSTRFSVSMRIFARPASSVCVHPSSSRRRMILRASSIRPYSTAGVSLLAFGSGNGGRSASVSSIARCHQRHCPAPRTRIATVAGGSYHLQPSGLGPGTHGVQGTQASLFHIAALRSRGHRRLVGEQG